MIERSAHSCCNITEGLEGVLDYIEGCGESESDNSWHNPASHCTINQVISLSGCCVTFGSTWDQYRTPASSVRVSPSIHRAQCRFLCFAYATTTETRITTLTPILLAHSPHSCHHPLSQTHGSNPENSESSSTRVPQVPGCRYTRGRTPGLSDWSSLPQNFIPYR